MGSTHKSHGVRDRQAQLHLGALVGRGGGGAALGADGPLRVVEAESQPHLHRWLRSSSLVEATVPPFGILSFPRVRGVSDTKALATFLAQEQGVAVVPGEAFGAPGHLRVACGVPESTLVEGLVRLEAGLQAWLERA